jgi:hypothetical protein
VVKVETKTALLKAWETSVSPTAKNQFDALMALAEHWRQGREARIAREWQVNLLVWALLVALAAKPNVLPGCSFRLGAILLVVGLHVLWIAWHWRRARQDDDRIFPLRKWAMLLATADGVPEAVAPMPMSTPDLRPSSVWAHRPTHLLLATDLILGAAAMLAQ